jgi:TrkA domain protein
VATRETELPGVGTKHTLDLATGDELVAVEHRAGHWELARVDADGNTTPLAQLNSREAGELGRILSRGAVSTEDSRKHMLFEEFAMEWVKLEEDSALVGSTLLGSGIRSRTGASVIAILRPEGSIASPPPDSEFRVGDTLVVMGHRAQVDAFLKGFTHISTEE